MSRPEPGARFGPTGLGVGIARRCRSAQPGDDLGERLATPLGERGTLRLAVVGQHHDAVRPRGEANSALDAPDLPVDVTQHGERVGALRPGVVGDLVVAEHVDVDRGAALAHVVEHAEHIDVTADDRRVGAHERVRPATGDARLDAVAHLLPRGDPLPTDLGDQADQRPRRVLWPREVPEVAGAEAALLALGDHAHRHHGALGVAGEQVAVARPVVGEQALAVGVVLLDRRRRRRVVGDDDGAGRLVDPAERRHVDDGAVEDAALADAGLRRPTGLPADQPVAAVAQPAMEGRHVARSQSPVEHGFGQPVDLHEDDTGHLGLGGDPRAPARSPGHRRLEPGVVVEGEEARHQRRHSGQPEHDHERRPPALERDARERVEHEGDHDRVEHDRPQPERQDGDRHDDDCQGRPHDGVDDADHEPGEERLPPLVDREVVEHDGEQPQRQRADDRDEDDPPHDDAQGGPLCHRPERRRGGALGGHAASGTIRRSPGARTRTWSSSPMRSSSARNRSTGSSSHGGGRRLTIDGL